MTSDFIFFIVYFLQVFHVLFLASFVFLFSLVFLFMICFSSFLSLLAFVSVFDCESFLRCRCSMEMWCPEGHRGGTSGIGLGHLLGREHVSTPQSGCGGSSPVKTEPLQVVLQLLLYVVWKFGLFGW